jgi:hypothetical protein
MQQKLNVRTWFSNVTTSSCWVEWASVFVAHAHMHQYLGHEEINWSKRSVKIGISMVYNLLHRLAKNRKGIIESYDMVYSLQKTLMGSVWQCCGIAGSDRVVYTIPLTTLLSSSQGSRAQNLRLQWRVCGLWSWKSERAPWAPLIQRITLQQSWLPR